ncbi:Phosphatidylinositide phosphatase SAC2 [Mactra antiquata]
MLSPQALGCDWRLLLVSKQTCVGQLAGKHDVYQLNKIAVLPLSDTETPDLDLDLCKMHHFGMRQTDRITQNSDGQGKSLVKALNTIKSAAENVVPKKKEEKDKNLKEKFEKRILEELIKMYNESDSFYYCKSHDLTNTIQRQYGSNYDNDLDLWQRCDKRFFWNLHMMQELMEIKTDLSSHWILPIMHGCIDIHHCCMDFNESTRDLSPVMPKPSKDPISYCLILISRRSRHRAGTRSKRRGLDDAGACANYVETEQIIEFSHHRVSFVQVRGSIPVYWSQTGVKYRPPPKLDKVLTRSKVFDSYLDQS